MFKTIREFIEITKPDPEGIINAPDTLNWNPRQSVEYRLRAGVHIQDGNHPDFPSLKMLEDGGWYQLSLLFVEHSAGGLHALVLLSMQDHEGPAWEYVQLDELLDCTSWDEFRDCLYQVSMDQGFNLTIDRVDAFMELMPEWFTASVV